MECDDDNDPVVTEVPVYLSKKISNKLHILQYPVRPQQITYDDSEIIQARIRPKCCQVEMQVGVKTKSYHYDEDKGKQIAVNVDGLNREMKTSEDNYFKSDMMDKISLVSSKNLQDCNKYAVGIVSDDAVHLTPLASFITLKPKCSYLDMADSRNQKDNEEEPEQEDLFNNLRKVSVRFEKHETEYRKNARERSYEFLQRKIREEPWVDIEVNKYGSERSEYDKRGLYCNYESEKVDCFRISNLEYLNQLVPYQNEPDIAPNSTNKEVLRNSLLNLSLQQHLSQLMVKANLATFSEIQSCLNREDCDASSIVKALQKEAVLIQGCWVLKSSILYPEDTSKMPKKYNITGPSCEILQRARDYALYLFTKNRIIQKSDIESKIDICGFQLINILEKIAVPVKPKGSWEFKLPTDHQFINKNKDVAQRQQMIWQSKHEQFVHTFDNS